MRKAIETLMNEIKRLYEWGNIPCQWKDIKMPVLSSLIYKLSNPGQNAAGHFGAINKLTLKFIPKDENIYQVFL